MSVAAQGSGTVPQTKRSSPALLILLECFFLSFTFVTLLFFITSAAFDNGLYWVGEILRRF
jgi:hypothetical protein